MRRRTLLAAAGLTIGTISGCLRGSPKPPTQREPGTASPSDQHAVLLGETVDGAITVADVAIQQSVRRLSTPDSIDVFAPAERQFLFAEVDASGLDSTPPAPTAFSLHLDDLTSEPIVSLDDVGIDTLLHESPPYNPPGDARPSAVGFLLFSLPTGPDPSAGSISLNADQADIPSVRWSFSQSELEAVTPPYPDLTVESLEVPSAVSGDTIPIIATVSNAGDGDGVLPAAVNHMGPFYAADTWDVSVPADETTVGEYEISYDWGDAETVRFAVALPRDRRVFSVGVDGG